MRYKKRKQDGSLGDYVYTPGDDVQLSPELAAAFNAIAEQFQLITEQQEQIVNLQAELAAMKGGAQ